MTLKLRGRVDVLSAYRQDVEIRHGSTDSHDANWLKLALLLSRSGSLPLQHGKRALDDAVSLGRSMLSGFSWKEGHRLDPDRPEIEDSLISRIRIIAEEAEDAGALHLADAMLVVFVEAYPGCGELEVGRIEIARARIAWKRGDLDVARMRLGNTMATTRKTVALDELKCRVFLAKALLARLVGNYPESDRLTSTALRYALKYGMSRLAAVANNNFLVVRARKADYQDAVAHGWQGFVLSKGDKVLESEILGNLGQVFLDMGHPGTAISAFRAVLDRHPPDRLRLPALGGYAIASAQNGDTGTLASITDTVLRHTDRSATPYVVASALLDLSDAHVTASDVIAARGFRDRAQRIAKQYGFNELVFRAEQRLPAELRRPDSFDANTVDVARAIEDLLHV